MNIEELIKLNDKSGKVLKESYVKKYYYNIYLDIKKYSDDNNLSQLVFKEKMYHYYNDIPNVLLCDCGKPVNFINFNKGYSKHCSQKCTHADYRTLEKSKITCIKKYGVDNPKTNKHIQEKT